MWRSLRNRPAIRDVAFCFFIGFILLAWPKIVSGALPDSSYPERTLKSLRQARPRGFAGSAWPLRSNSDQVVRPLLTAS